MNVNFISKSKTILFITRWSFFSLVFFGYSKAYSAESPKLSVFQSQIQSCGIDIKNMSEVKSFDQIYKGLSELLLVSERIVYKELVYKTKAERRKLKVTNDSIEIFKIGEEDRHFKITVESRQKSKTTRAAISQFILNTKTESDWEKIAESREGGLQIEFVRDNGKLTQLNIKSSKSDKKLECLIVNGSEICLCNK